MRYRAVIRSEETESWEDWKPLLPELEVERPEPVDTGLLDHHGNKIYRFPNPIGFNSGLEG